MEIADAEFRAELFLGPPAQLLHLDHPDLAARGLAGHHEIALHLGTALASATAKVSVNDRAAWSSLHPLESGPVSTTRWFARQISAVGRLKSE